MRSRAGHNHREHCTKAAFPMPLVVGWMTEWLEGLLRFSLDLYLWRVLSA